MPHRRPSHKPQHTRENKHEVFIPYHHITSYIWYCSNGGSFYRVRTPFAIAFVILSLFSLWLGTTTASIPINDKFLHYAMFFILTVLPLPSFLSILSIHPPCEHVRELMSRSQISFYWILDTSRRRVFNLTFFVVLLDSRLLAVCLLTRLDMHPLSLHI